MSREVNIEGLGLNGGGDRQVRHPDCIYLNNSGSCWVSSSFLPITSGSTWRYDIVYSSSVGNMFYIGFEIYDANKTSTSNNSCTYPVATKNGTTGIVRKRGTVDLSTDAGGRVGAFTKIRILHNWTNTTVTGSAEVYRVSLQEISPGENLKNKVDISKKGVFHSDNVFEYGNEVQPDKYGLTTLREIVEY